jgi:hypothetical protein
MELYSMFDFFFFLKSVLMRYKCEKYFLVSEKYSLVGYTCLF